MKNNRINVSQAFFLEIDEEESAKRVQKRRLDPETGIYYNFEFGFPENQAIVDRLIEAKQDKHLILKNRLDEWKNNVPGL